MMKHFHGRGKVRARCVKGNCYGERKNDRNHVQENQCEASFFDSGGKLSGVPENQSEHATRGPPILLFANHMNNNRQIARVLTPTENNHRKQ